MNNDRDGRPQVQFHEEELDPPADFDVMLDHALRLATRWLIQQYRREHPQHDPAVPSTEGVSCPQRE